jgi:hypothetical protein
MAVESRVTLKSWFEAQDKPTQSQFASLIDSFLHKDEYGGAVSGVNASPYAIKALDTGMTVADVNKFVVLKDKDTVMLPVGVDFEGRVGEIEVNFTDFPTGPTYTEKAYRLEPTGLGDENFAVGDVIRITQSIDEPYSEMAGFGVVIGPISLINEDFTFVAGAPANANEVTIGADFTASTVNLNLRMIARFGALRDAAVHIAKIEFPFSVSGSSEIDHFMLRVFYEGHYFGTRPNDWQMHMWLNVSYLPVGTVLMDCLPDVPASVDGEMNDFSVSTLNQYVIRFESPPVNGDDTIYLEDILSSWTISGRVATGQTAGYYQVPTNANDFIDMIIWHVQETAGLVEYWEASNPESNLLLLTTILDTSYNGWSPPTTQFNFVNFVNLNEPLHSYENRVVADIYGQLVAVQGSNGIVYIGKNWSNLILDNTSDAVDVYPMLSDLIDQLILNDVEFVEAMEDMELTPEGRAILYMLKTLLRVVIIQPGGTCKLLLFNIETLLLGAGGGEETMLIDGTAILAAEDQVAPGGTFTGSRFNILKLMIKIWGPGTMENMIGG